MLPKKGRKLPDWEGALAGRKAYAEVVAELLRKEHGDSHRAVKQLMRLTDASERSVKHWMAAQHGPDTVFFLRLVATSPVIRAFVLGVIESPRSGQQSSELYRPINTANMPATLRREQGAPENDPINDPDHDPMNDPVNGGFNERQRWFLDRVGRGFRVRARDLMMYWKVSPKTAKRDISGLCTAGRLRFIGARRNGHYELIR